MIFFFLTGGQRPVSGSGQEGCAFWAQALHIWRHLLLKVRSLNKLLYHKQQRRDGRFKLLTKTLCKRKKSFCWKNVGGQLIFSYHWHRHDFIKTLHNIVFNHFLYGWNWEKGVEYNVLCLTTIYELAIFYFGFKLYLVWMLFLFKLSHWFSTNHVTKLLILL